jgi:hypothetical protein
MKANYFLPNTRNQQCSLWELIPAPALQVPNGVDHHAQTGSRCRRPGLRANAAHFVAQRQGHAGRLKYPS